MNEVPTQALRISSFARKYDLSEMTVRRRIARGELKAIRIGKMWRVIDSFDQLLSHRSEEPASLNT